mgnify:CR=1 FL=1
MHQALAGAFSARGTRVVPGCFQRVNAEHTSIPITHAFVTLGFVHNIKAEAGWAEEGADPAAEAGLSKFTPQVAIENLVQMLLEPIRGESWFKLRLGLLLYLSLIHI